MKEVIILFAMMLSYASAPLFFFVWVFTPSHLLKNAIFIYRPMYLSVDGESEKWYFGTYLMRHSKAYMDGFKLRTDYVYSSIPKPPMAVRTTKHKVKMKGDLL